MAVPLPLLLAGTAEDVHLLVPSHPIIIKEKQPGSISFELDTAQVIYAAPILALGV